MWRTAVVLAAVTIMPLLSQSPGEHPDSKAMPVPALPYVDRDVCPFEGCVYGEWAARKSAVIYDTWEKKRRPIAHLTVGDKLTGITGVVITFRPGVIRMDRELPAEGLKRGDTILTYSYRGEGFSAVWFKGRYHSEFDITFARSDGKRCSAASCSATYVDMGVKSWWAQVKLQSGRIGWVDMDRARFDGVDQLARMIGLTAAGA